MAQEKLSLNWHLRIIKRHWQNRVEERLWLKGEGAIASAGQELWYTIQTSWNQPENPSGRHLSGTTIAKPCKQQPPKKGLPSQDWLYGLSLLWESRRGNMRVREKLQTPKFLVATPDTKTLATKKLPGTTLPLDMSDMLSSLWDLQYYF